VERMRVHNLLPANVENFSALCHLQVCIHLKCIERKVLIQNVQALPSILINEILIQFIVLQNKMYHTNKLSFIVQRAYFQYKPIRECIK